MKERLTKLLDNSYSPVYKYSVACIIVCHDGKEFEGVNVETSSPAAGICAERNALFSVITAGYKKGDIKTIYLMNKTEEPCFPCFICRQALCDFCDSNTSIVSYNYKGEITKEVLVKDLCPFPFGTNDLNEGSNENV